MAKEKKVSKVEKTGRKPDYSVNVLVNGLELGAQSDSLHEAVASVFNSKDFPFAIKSKVVVSYSKNGVEGSTRVIPINTARRLVNLASLKPDVVELLVSKLLN